MNVMRPRPRILPDLSATNAIIDQLRIRVAALEEALGASTFPTQTEKLRIPHNERVLLGMLVTKRLVTKQAFMAAARHQDHNDSPDSRMTDIYICKLRKKFAPHGIVIKTEWGQGWYMESEMADKCLSIFGGA